MEITKQAVNQSRIRQNKFNMELMDIIQQADIVRNEHPGCGVEKLYKVLKPRYVGRDKFYEILLSNLSILNAGLNA